ncbi:MAG TPA: site-2 protease family protein [Candidatus Acidoferrales bacterium]|nr:site-2 protease family protein [Candidatus Acidoferrales bacterium]
MIRQQIPLGRIFGISIGLDYSWFLIFVLLTWSLALTYYPAAVPGQSASLYWALGAVSAVMLFVSVLLHELGHSVTALRYGIPVRSIRIFIFGGVSQIAGEAPSGAAEFWIAFSGPAVSLALAAIFRLLQASLTGIGPVFAVVKYLAYVNGALALFNLIPGFPLDGGRVLRAILWTTTRDFRRATLTAAMVGRAIAFGFILWGVSQILTGNLGSGLWIAFIGWFLESAASAQVQQQVLERVLAGHTVAEVMNRNYVTVPASTRLQELVDRHILGGGRRSFIVTQGDQTVGLVTLGQIREVPRERWDTTTVDEAMTPLARLKRVRPDTGLWAATGEMDRDGVNQLPVMTDSQILGMLGRDDVMSYLRTLQELGVWPGGRGAASSARD